MVMFYMIFFVISIGFGVADFIYWFVFVVLILVIFGYLGGCFGFIVGGNKFICNIFFLKLIVLEIKCIMYL